MEEKISKAGPVKFGGKNFRKMGKPLAFLFAVFIIGFAFPVLLKNYLGEKTGLAPAPEPKSEAMRITAPYYRFEPEEVNLTIGETAEVKVFLNTDKKAIEAFDFIANYDPAVVEAVEVSATPLFPSYPAIEYGNGVITVGGNIGIDESFSINDLLVVITLEGKAKGETELSVDKKASTIAAKGENILKDSNSVKIEIRDKR